MIIEKQKIIMENQAHKYLQQKQWTAAVRLCAKFRNTYYQGREEEDI